MAKSTRRSRPSVSHNRFNPYPHSPESLSVSSASSSSTPSRPSRLVRSNAMILGKPGNTPSLSLSLDNGNNLEERILNAVRRHLVNFKGPMDERLSQDLECAAADAICIAFQIVQRCHASKVNYYHVFTYYRHLLGYPQVTSAPISHPHAPTETAYLQEPIEVVQKQPIPGAWSQSTVEP
ncbi:hypothetical protein EDD15DRAFT_2204013 [Pisolithus albus]|nr:hypothetical protein EDD15DRAFT_2204013 [Pisolithus albus]